MVAGVSAILLLRKSNREFAETGLSLAMWIVLFLVPLQMFLGDQHGQIAAVSADEIGCHRGNLGYRQQRAVNVICVAGSKSRH